MPWDDAIDDAGLTILLAELAHAHADFFPAQASEYGPHARASIEFGRTVDAAAYIAASQRRRAFAGEMNGLFQEVDLLITPGLGIPVPSLSELEALASDLDAVRRSLYRFTSPYNLAGVPTLSFPGGFSGNGLPLGLQLAAGRLKEDLLCRVGHAYQQVTGHHVRRPDLA